MKPLRINKYFSIAAVILLLILIFTSCQSKDTDEIKIGSILGLTGNYAAYGVKMQRGFDLALNEINALNNEDNQKIKLIVEDSQFDPTKSVTAYKKLIGIDGIKIIVGITGSRNALPVCEVSKNDDIVIIDALGSAPKLTTDGGPNYFRIMASDALAGKYNVAWAIENGMKKPAIVFIEDEWGTSYRDAVIKYLSNSGVEEFESFGINAGMKDFRTIIERIRKFNPDTIFLLIYAREGSSFIKQLRQAGITPKIYGSDNISSTEFISAGNEVVEGIFVAMPAPVKGENYERFVETYRSVYNEEPDANVIKSYDALMLTYNAILKVGTEPAKLRSLFGSGDFSYGGISGEIKFDENGDLLDQEYTRMVYRNGKLEKLDMSIK
jgi:branched-chain amino acid transport system substrate-binding protein